MPHKRLLLLTALFAAASWPAQSQTPISVRKLIQQFQKAYLAKSLGRIEGKGHQIEVNITHSLSGDDEKRTCGSMTEVESWLRSKETDDLPTRAVLGKYHFENGVASYDYYGISHNHLYLNSLTISIEGKSPRITRIVLENGD